MDSKPNHLHPVLSFSSHFSLYLKGEEALCHIAEECHHNIGEHIGRRSINAAGIVEKFYKEVSKYDTDANGNEIPKHLDASLQVGFLKDNVARHYEAIRRRYEEGYNRSGDWRAYRNDRRVHIQLVKEKMVGAVIHGDIERSAGAATGEVAESLRIDPACKGPVEEVNNA